MFHRLAIGLLLACLIPFLGACSESSSQGASTPLILSATRIGEFELRSDSKLDLQDLRKLFAGLAVEQKVGQQDGPDYVYFAVSDGKGELFWIKADDTNPQLLASVHVVSERIRDQHGLKIGSTYKDVLRVRPRLMTETDYHFHTYVGHPKENIVYEMTVSYQEGYQGPDREPTEQEVANSKVSELIWFVRR